MKKQTGKLLPLFAGLRRSRKKDNPAAAQSGTQLFRQMVNYVRDRARERHLGWTLIPALITLRIVSAENLRAIRSAFEAGLSGERPVHPDLFSDFLEMRRYFTAAIVFKAAENWRENNATRKISERIEDILGELQFLSDYQAWDWVSFHETEVEFFIEVANLSRVNSARFALNRIKRDYLDSVLAYNKNFWNMQSALDIYRTVWRLIRERKAPEAEGEILQFFSQNDLAILQYYSSQILAKGYEITPAESGAEPRPVYASSVAQLSDNDIGHAIRSALAEDRASADITTQAIFTVPEKARGRIFVKSSCVVCGVRIAEQTFRYFDPAFSVTAGASDGADLIAGQTVLEFSGDIRAILRGERVALNFLGLMSGLATQTRRVQKLADTYGVKVLDTRKTIPMLREISKYAVVIGGGLNHRHNLAEMGLIKDNHIAHAGSVTAAVLAFRRHAPFVPLEVEVDDLDQLRELLPLKPEMILLDNMENAKMAEAMRMIKAANATFGTKITAEASGNFSFNNLERLKDTGVDYVSLGSITNRVEPPDFSLEILS